MSENLEEWKKNVEYFREHKKEIEEKYGRKQYVAINYKKGVIGDDKDKFKLDKRMRRFHSDISCLITSIESSERKVKIDSPFIVK